MTVQECYAKLNGCYEDALKRLMRDNLIERFMLMFPNDESMKSLRASIAANDQNGCFRAIHSLKGVAGNLAFTKLQRDASMLTEQLRSGEEMPDEALLKKVEDSYKEVIDTLEEYVKEK